ncbi:sigma-70 family RNA polymerase sigma factor [Actinoplanes couchii]|uniref:RNA polymerase sigma factor n=1 Tax=Actinoplanes couchii TaxID=403638 RepID=A0ABQ3XDH2_9ACTN|nr:sigma-70 family RNA polymerase sigma factor [Actinoplanes couchii]MDR6321335.1 RNA polymerase sigma-70 factor (ECF subfamily) [Actinoplanes couchii]GID56445.1 RNA polymerase sigma factor [Actinoplanes couchii]
MMIDHGFTHEIHHRHGTALLRFARTLTLGDAHAAEDIVQETLVRAWRHADRLGTAPAQLRPWLFTVVRRLAIDGHRAKQARPAEIDEEEMLTRPVPDGTDHTLDRQVVRDALRTLESEYREVLVHRYLLDHSVEETAAELSIPTGTVKSRSSKALRTLRATLTTAR